MQDIQDRVKSIILDPWRITLANNGNESIAPRGVLIYGPSGVGKTQFGMALAQEIGFNHVVVNGSDIRSKIVGESEANIRKIFEDVRQKSPCVLFIDQLDAVVPRRGAESTSENSGNRVVTSFLTEMDGILASTQSVSHLIIIAVTNNREAIDPAILRPGRINEFLYIAPPAEKERTDIFRGFLNGVPNNLTDAEFGSLGSQSVGCSGADIENYCREAAFVCMREDACNSQCISSNHVSDSAGKRKRSSSNEGSRSSPSASPNAFIIKDTTTVPSPPLSPSGTYEEWTIVRQYMCMHGPTLLEFLDSDTLLRRFCVQDVAFRQAILAIAVQHNSGVGGSVDEVGQSLIHYHQSKVAILQIPIANSIKNLQTLLFLTRYALAKGQTHEAKSHFQSALKIVLEMQLNIDPDNSPTSVPLNLTEKQKQERRILFWVVYYILKSNYPKKLYLDSF
ncbi:UNVERIFIED_CONTAM: Cell division control protein 48 B [Siphonaria sp. JEL0065]|nr:Cell division control protein 48 B [Siphonaria sp. JEL0065]